jgi:VanZ family protein
VVKKEGEQKDRVDSRNWTGWLWPLALMGSVVMVSDQSAVGSFEIYRFDKLAHFCVFGLIATLILRMLPLSGRGVRNGLIAVLIVSLFGITDEFHQSSTPGRSVEFADWVADTLGAITAVWFYLKWSWYRKVMESKKSPSAPASIDGET